MCQLLDFAGRPGIAGSSSTRYSYKKEGSPLARRAQLRSGAAPPAVRIEGRTERAELKTGSARAHGGAAQIALAGAGEAWKAIQPNGRGDLVTFDRVPVELGCAASPVQVNLGLRSLEARVHSAAETARESIGTARAAKMLHKVARSVRVRAPAPSVWARVCHPSAAGLGDYLPRTRRVSCAVGRLQLKMHTWCMLRRATVLKTHACILSNSTQPHNQQQRSRSRALVLLHPGETYCSGCRSPPHPQVEGIE